MDLWAYVLRSLTIRLTFSFRASAPSRKTEASFNGYEPAGVGSLGCMVKFQVRACFTFDIVGAADTLRAKLALSENELL